MSSPAAEGIGFLRRAERFSSVLNEHDLSLIYRRHPTQERRQVTRSHGQLQARSRAPAHYVYTWYFMYRALGVILCNRERDLLPYHTKFGSPKYGPKVHILRNVLTSFAQQRMSQPPASCLSSGTHTLDVQFSTRVLRAPSVEAFGQVSGSPRTVSIRCCCAGRSFVRAIYL